MMLFNFTLNIFDSQLYSYIQAVSSGYKHSFQA